MFFKPLSFDKKVWSHFGENKARKGHCNRRALLITGIIIEKQTKQLIFPRVFGETQHHTSSVK